MRPWGEHVRWDLRLLCAHLCVLLHVTYLTVRSKRLLVCCNFWIHLSILLIRIQARLLSRAAATICPVDKRLLLQVVSRHEGTRNIVWVASGSSAAGGHNVSSNSSTFVSPTWNSCNLIWIEQNQSSHIHNLFTISRLLLLNVTDSPMNITLRILIFWASVQLCTH